MIKKELRPRFEVKIHPATYKHMVTHLSVQAPIEGCGLLFERDSLAVKYTPVPNIHSRPTWNFRMDPVVFTAEIAESDKWGYRLIAFVHSHPGTRDTTPSAYDIASYMSDEHKFPNMVHVILAWHKGDLSKPMVTVWRYPDVAGRLVQSHEGSKLI